MGFVNNFWDLAESSHHAGFMTGAVGSAIFGTGFVTQLVQPVQGKRANEHCSGPTIDVQSALNLSTEILIKKHVSDMCFTLWVLGFCSFFGSKLGCSCLSFSIPEDAEPASRGPSLMSAR